MNRRKLQRRIALGEKIRWKWEFYRATGCIRHRSRELMDSIFNRDPLVHYLNKGLYARAALDEQKQEEAFEALGRYLKEERE